MLHRRRSTASTHDTAPSSDEPWSKADVFFLRDALRRGLSVAEIARFLRRTEKEVREKAKEVEMRCEPHQPNAFSSSSSDNCSSSPRLARASHPCATASRSCF
jgi:hypothetical protein